MGSSCFLWVLSGAGAQNGAQVETCAKHLVVSVTRRTDPHKEYRSTPGALPPPTSLADSGNSTTLYQVYTCASRDRYQPDRSFSEQWVLQLLL
jgi:hypothetical protein